MTAYQLYFFDRQGKVGHCVELDCASDEAAIERVNSFHRTHIVELCCVNRQVRTFGPSELDASYYSTVADGLKELAARSHDEGASKKFSDDATEYELLAQQARRG